MILWHLGVGCALVYVTLGRRRIDYRFIMAGAVSPDLIDAALGPFVDEGPAGRGIAHSLLAVVVVAALVIVGLRGKARLSAFGLAVGWLTHIVADGMWQAPETFLWPAFGWSEFAASPGEPYTWDLARHPADHVWTWLGELAGLAGLTWFWVAYRFGDKDRRRKFLNDGYLRP